MQEIKEISLDILCMEEGPKGEAAIDRFANDLIGGDYVAVKATDGIYDVQGDQWIWFLVKKDPKDAVSLLQIDTWDSWA